MATFYLSRARLKSDITVKTLSPLLLGAGVGSGTAPQPGHHLMWSLFGDGTGRTRDFLWRELAHGTFFILSARPPDDRHGLFDVAPPKIFEPDLVDGDRLGFSLRANPVVRRRDPSRDRSVKHDVVMDALRDIEEGGRAAHRLAAIQERGFSWLKRQGDNAGFAVTQTATRVDGYEQHRFARKGGPPMSFSTLDFDGVLTVTAPSVFLSAIVGGFGAAKAYGCGLMLIRRRR